MLDQKKTQTQIAKDLGFKKTTLNSWCKGVSFPTSGKLQALADYFCVGKSYFLEEDPFVLPDIYSRMNYLWRNDFTKYTSQLNDEGICKLLERAEELCQIEKYRKRED